MGKSLPWVAATIALAMLGTPRAAAAADLHLVWDGTCGGCHGHAGAFARKSLTVEDGELRGRRHRLDLAEFLRSHNGGYPADDIAAIVAMLREQATTPDLFRRKCGACHTTAAQLAREQLVSRDGTLIGRHSHRNIGDFLPGHVRLTPDQTAKMLDVLTRVEGEVHRR